MASTSSKSPGPAENAGFSHGLLAPFGPAGSSPAAEPLAPPGDIAANLSGRARRFDFLLEAALGGLLLIWLGCIVMVIGGGLSLSDRRLRIGAPKPARVRAAMAPAE